MNIPLRTFRAATGNATSDFDHRAWMHRSLDGYRQARAATHARYPDWDAARDAAAGIKWEALDQLDVMLEILVSKLEARGTHVFWAEDAAAARGYILDVVRRRNARTVVKSKCMTTEEIHLNAVLEEEGFRVVESDLGEFIVQLRREPPYHFVFPAMHLRRESIGQLFARELGTEYTDDPETLTATARRVLRRHYIEADVGISGANFAIAETGMISITENEGNARLTTSLPPVHIAVLGIEKVIPRLGDLALYLPMLATAGTGQALTCYNSLIAGPRRQDDVDGPEELHVVLLDNRRTALLADPFARDALRCIRCGACLNVCPVFGNIGGHSYGTTYQGPVGSVITPHLRGMTDWQHLSHASSLCGACTDTCPVRIDLHHHLLRNRDKAARETPRWRLKFAFAAFAFVMRRPWAYRLAGVVGRWLLTVSRPFRGTRLDPLGSWSRTRDLPAPARQTFKSYWRSRKK